MNTITFMSVVSIALSHFFLQGKYNNVTALKINIVVWPVTLRNYAVWLVVANISEEHATLVLRVEDTGSVLSKMLVEMCQITWGLNPGNLLLVPQDP
jgi:diacylglycerol kinase